ncbi:MAG: hypothetical protein AAGK78_17525, partial [Planctomycetota bacterium]
MLSINGKPVGRVLADVSPLVPVDGWTDHATYVEMEYSSEFKGSAVDNFWPFLCGWPEMWTIETRSRETGEVRSFELEPVVYEQAVLLATGDTNARVNFPDTVDFKALDDETAYLSIGTFVNYRKPVVPETVFDPIFDQIKEGGYEHLVLDLRQCGGGSDDVPASLTSYLTDEVLPVGKRPIWLRAKRLGDLEPYVQ